MNLDILLNQILFSNFIFDRLFVLVYTNQGNNAKSFEA